MLFEVQEFEAEVLEQVEVSEWVVIVVVAEAEFLASIEVEAEVLELAEVLT